MSSKAFSVMLLTLMLAATSNAGTLRPGGKTAIKDRYIVVLKDVAPGDVRGVAEAIGRAQNSTTFSPMRGAIRAFGIIMNEHRARALTHHPLVDYIEQDEWLSVASEKTAFDFREDGTAAKAGKAPATAEKSFRPWTTALTSCPWNGSYYHCSYADDTYWALDRLDQTGPLHSVPRGYGYTTGGTNVRAYMVGFGVHAAHSEFDSRVLAGYNMMADPEVIHAGGHPGEETDVTSTDSTPANNPCGMWPGRDANTAHDTAAASVLGGNTTGVAKDVLIVPVKVIQCLNSNDYRLSKLALARGLDLIYNDVTGLRWQFGAAVPAVAVIAPYWHGTSADLGNECECVGPQGGTCTWDPNTSKYWKNCVSMIEEEINSLASIRIASVVPATNHSDDTCSRAKVEAIPPPTGRLPSVQPCTTDLIRGERRTTGGRARRSRGDVIRGAARILDRALDHASASGHLVGTFGLLAAQVQALTVQAMALAAGLRGRRLTLRALSLVYSRAILTGL